MKKILISLILLLNISSFSYEAAYSALSNGYFITEMNSDEVRPLASLTKLMTVLVVLDEVDKGNITLNDLIKIDRKVNVGESSIPLEQDDKLTVEELLKAALIYSANNAAYALSLYISKTEDDFVKLMNEKAKELKMYNTTYYTSTGLPTRYTKKKLDVSTAKDQYLLAKYAMSDSRIRQYANQKNVLIKGQYFRNRNKIIGKNGNIGLKTGYHLKAGFNMIGVFNEYGADLIVVTMGDKTLKERFVSQLGINDLYKSRLYKIYSKDEFFDDIKINNARENFVKTKLASDFYYYKKEGIKTKIVIHKILGKVKVGDEVASLMIYDGTKFLKEIPIISQDNTNAISVWDRVKTWF